MYLQYFKFNDEIPSEEILKTLWRKIAINLHPDKGGNPENFKEAQNEYEYLLKNIGASFTAKEDSPFNYESWDDFLAGIDPSVEECLNAIREIGILNFEITGKWIWVTLDKSEIDTRQKLKEIEVNGIKFRFSRNKLRWYWAGAKSRSRRSHSMDYIREQYGSLKYKEEREKLAA